MEKKWGKEINSKMLERLRKTGESLLMNLRKREQKEIFQNFPGKGVRNDLPILINQI